MLTASITLSPQRSIAPFSPLAITHVCRKFKSKIVLSRGNTNSINIKSIAELQRFSSENSPKIEIVVNGKDEMNAAGTLLDYFNYGLGI
jgi:phosphotransferase system HPr-like phosphotransfer protein